MQKVVALVIFLQLEVNLIHSFIHSHTARTHAKHKNTRQTPTFMVPMLWDRVGNLLLSGSLIISYVAWAFWELEFSYN